MVHISGSGKTTLIDVLSMRNYSSNLILQNGVVKVNGKTVNAERMSSLSAYDQQDGLFIETLTPREHLMFQVKK